MNGWTALLIAGAFEVGFTYSMKMSELSERRVWGILFLVCAILSFQFLSEAVKTIPLGTAYAVWTGIGAVGTALLGILLFKESVSMWRLFFLALLIGSILGLKLVTRDAATV